jgi:hypothetical protein
VYDGTSNIVVLGKAKERKAFSFIKQFLSAGKQSIFPSTGIVPKNIYVNLSVTS